MTKTDAVQLDVREKKHLRNANRSLSKWPEKKVAPDAAPMVRVKVGTFQHWRIVNATKGLHVMHIHQVNFLAHAENGNRVADRLWLDTVNVPYGGFVDVIMDFTDPVIKGMSVFHCHLLNHEDNGIMAKILFQ